jgi:nitrilase
MNSGPEVERNLQSARRLLEEAAGGGCELAVLPENFALMPKKSRDKAAHAESPGDGPIQGFLAETARQLGLWVVGGSIPLVSPETERVYGACPVYDSDGVQQACYLKIHLFDVRLPDSDEAYQESWSMYPGDEPVAVDTPAGRLGLSICYDLRFPELYRRLVDDGASVFTVPAAFTRTTG